MVYKVELINSDNLLILQHWIATAVSKVSTQSWKQKWNVSFKQSLLKVWYQMERPLLNSWKRRRRWHIMLRT